MIFLLSLNSIPSDAHCPLEHVEHEHHASSVIVGSFLFDPCDGRERLSLVHSLVWLVGCLSLTSCCFLLEQYFRRMNAWCIPRVLTPFVRDFATCWRARQGFLSAGNGGAWRNLLDRRMQSVLTPRWRPLQPSTTWTLWQYPTRMNTRRYIFSAVCLKFNAYFNWRVKKKRS